jgi:aconitate hydratase 2/2-methylisocitrate dehydratase
MTKSAEKPRQANSLSSSVDLELQHSLPDFMRSRGGVTLKPGDGIIHSWLNRMLLPDTVGTGGDSHTRFPPVCMVPLKRTKTDSGISRGNTPIDAPNATKPEPAGKLIPIGKRVCESPPVPTVSGSRILEIEGLGDLKIEQAFELTDASAERSSNGCTIKLNQAPTN